MEGGGAAHYNPQTVEEVFRDFKGRRAGIIQALTTGLLLLFAFFKFEFCLMGSDFFMETLLTMIVWCMIQTFYKKN